MQVTDKQRKLIWAGAALIGICYFAPSVITKIHQASAPEEPVVAKPSPVRVALPPAPRPNPEALKAAATAAEFNRLAGDWSGAALLPSRGLCKLGMQIRTIPDKPATYKGYSTTSCNISLALMGKRASKENMARDTINAMTPTSTIMTGEIVNGQIAFRIDSNIGVPPDGCAVTAFTVSPFADQIAAQWQAGTCQGGQMVLNRVSNLR